MVPSFGNVVDTFRVYLITFVVARKERSIISETRFFGDERNVS